MTLRVVTPAIFKPGSRTIKGQTPLLFPRKDKKRQNKESKNNPEEKTSVFVIPEWFYQESK